MPVIKADKHDQATIKAFELSPLVGASFEVSKDVTHLQQSLEYLLAAIENAKIEMFRANEMFLVNLVYRIAKIVLLKELSIDRNYIVRLAEDLIERLDVRDNIQIQIAPVDFENFARIKQVIEKKFGMMKNLNIEACDHIQSGGCFIKTEWNTIDASIETQLSGIYESLLGKP